MREESVPRESTREKIQQTVDKLQQMRGAVDDDTDVLVGLAIKPPTIPFG